MNNERKKLIAYGTHLFPSFFIGNKEEYMNILNLISEWSNLKYSPAMSGQQSKQIEKEIDKLLKQTYNFRYSDCWIIFRKNGFFYIARKDKDLDRKFAVEKLNEILAIFTYHLTIPFHSINHYEVRKIGHRDLRIKSIQYRSDTALSKLISRQVHSPNKEYHFNDFITPKRVQELVNTSEILSEHPNITQYLYFFQKASQFKYNYELGMAFLMYFLIIERFYRQLFDDLNNRSQLKKKYKEESKMKLHNILEILHSNGVISTKKQNIFLTLKDTRNQFAHGKLKQEISMKFIEECGQLTKELLDELISDFITFQ